MLTKLTLKPDQMGHTRVKTTYGVEGAYASTETRSLYCHHNHVADFVTFRDEDGSLTQMIFQLDVKDFIPINPGPFQPSDVWLDTRSLAALNQRLWTWIEDEYLDTPHRGLQDACLVPAALCSCE